jgi:hypothetical protein
MARPGKTDTPVTAPICPNCQRAARLTTGAEIYSNRFDLYEKFIWKCDGCEAYVGCHGDTKKPLGFPANKSLRDKRMKVHSVIDPIWQRASETSCYGPKDTDAKEIIMRAAHHRVYGYLAEKMGIERKQCHTAMFTMEQCDRAIAILAGIDYEIIRDWHKAKKREAA